jgi:hypothetical protein
MTERNSDEEGICKYYIIKFKDGVTEETATEEDIEESCSEDGNFNDCANCKKYATA